MAEHQLIAILSLAFGLGLLHALDADHIMAVSGLASRQPSFKKSLMFCLRWAIGHASALLIIGGAVFFVGAAIPDRLSHFAEQAVGVMLLLLGSWIIYDLRLRNLRLHSHQHQGLPRHIHWHSPQLNHSSSDKSDHSAVLVGILHGVAGDHTRLGLVWLRLFSAVWTWRIRVDGGFWRAARWRLSIYYAVEQPGILHAENGDWPVLPVLRRLYPAQYLKRTADLFNYV
jgi:ABC-type nickel/cobalt efflux system permease component RcnA